MMQIIVGQSCHSGKRQLSRHAPDACDGWSLKAVCNSTVMVSDGSTGAAHAAVDVNILDCRSKDQMEQDILTELERLERRIQTEDIPKEAGAIEEWGGADVIIKNRLDKNTKKWLEDQPSVISFQNIEPRPRITIPGSRDTSFSFIVAKKMRHIIES